MNNEIAAIGSKPSGCTGNIAGRIMNRIHSSSYKKIINNIIMRYFPDENKKSVLDIGCGGGISVKLFSDIKEINEVVGIDYSEGMVKLSKAFNKKYINSGKVSILHADVSALPLENEHFDIITAFDTINFWADHKKAISEIIRILKINGVFFIINAYPKVGTKWHGFIKFKSDREYREFLIRHGLKNIKSELKKNTIIIWGWK